MTNYVKTKYVIAVPINMSNIRWLYYDGGNGFVRDLWSAKIYENSPTDVCEYWKTNHAKNHDYRVQEAVVFQVYLEIGNRV